MAAQRMAQHSRGLCRHRVPLSTARRKTRLWGFAWDQPVGVAGIKASGRGVEERSELAPPATTVIAARAISRQPRQVCGLITPLQRFEASDSQRGRQQPRSALPHAGSGAPSDRRLVPPFIIILCLAI